MAYEYGVVDSRRQIKYSEDILYRFSYVSERVNDIISLRGV